MGSLFTFWTDLRYKEPPFVEVTEGGMFMGNNCSINWDLNYGLFFFFINNKPCNYNDNSQNR